MEIKSAKRAGELAAQIEELTARVSGLQAFVANGARITVFRVADKDGREVTISVDGADLEAAAKTSAVALGYAIGLYQSQLDTLQAELAAL